MIGIARNRVLEHLRERGFANVPPDLRTDILRFFSDGRALAAIDDDDERAKVSKALAQLDVAFDRPGVGSPSRCASRESR